MSDIVDTSEFGPHAALFAEIKAILPDDTTERLNAAEHEEAREEANDTATMYLKMGVLLLSCAEVVHVGAPKLTEKLDGLPGGLLTGASYLSATSLGLFGLGALAAAAGNKIKAHLLK